MKTSFYFKLRPGDLVKFDDDVRMVVCADITFIDNAIEDRIDITWFSFGKRSFTKKRIWKTSYYSSETDYRQALVLTKG